MKKSFHAAWIYTALGLIGGLFYRTWTKTHPSDLPTRLGVVHTHLLALGMIVFLVVCALTVLLPELDQHPQFRQFFWTYNVGLVVTAGAMLVHGILQSLGHTGEIPAIAGTAGLGHMLLTVALVLFFVAFGRSLPERVSASAPDPSGSRSA